MGLLLYKGGTVCDDSFTDTAADAICKDMNYTRAISWTSSLDFGLVQERRSIMLDDVSCDTTEWESCFYEEDHNCDHSEDVFLSCSREGGKLLNIILIFKSFSRKEYYLNLNPK